MQSYSLVSQRSQSSGSPKLFLPRLAEGQGSYGSSSPGWVEVLVDCPGAQGLYTYDCAGLSVEPGDILSVPFGSQQLGAIAVRGFNTLPDTLDPETIRAVDDIICAKFFPLHYWSLLQRVASYYQTSMMAVIRVALPPGLLGRSQRRIRLQPEAIPPGADTFLNPAARELLQRLRSQKQGDYTWTYLQRNIRGAHRGLKDLLQRGWVTSYLEPPTPVKPKQQRAVTLVDFPATVDLSDRQREIIEVLKRRGGDLWLQELLQICHVSSSVVKTLEQKGCIVVQSREMLRTATGAVTSFDSPKILTEAQQSVLTEIQALQGYRVVLLHGITGSGKTEVYLQAIAPLLDQGKSALILVPEIGLTPQLTDRVQSRFGDRVRVYHSGLSDGERYDTWRQMLTGTPQVLIGTRSAIFAPLPNLGLIILDEEHDSSFKQDQPAPCYHARTIAHWRSELSDCPLILGSATPSLESWVESQGRSEERGERSKERGARREESAKSPSWEGLGVGSSESEERGARSEEQEIGSRESGEKSEESGLSPSWEGLGVGSPVADNALYLSLPERVHARPLPPVQVVDMRIELKAGHRSIFSRPLELALQELQDKNQQGLLFIHRRGHSTFVSCRSCGEVLDCPHCDVSLSYHHTHAEATPFLRCHYCNYGRSLPSQCPSCGSSYLKQFGSGTQRVVQELARKFPKLRYLRFDSDTTRTKGAHRAILTQFAQGEAHLLVGTQMLTKGLDIPGVTLVGVVSADGILNLADYRASERAFQLLTQVSGRAGRGEHPGRVIIQTYTPEHPVIQAVAAHEYRPFVDSELESRADLHYPPYGQLILLRLSSHDAQTVEQTAYALSDRLCPEFPDQVGYELLGPAPASVFRVARRYRWQLLLKLRTPEAINQLPDFDEVRSLCPSTVHLTIDVDPLNFL